ncbi:MAG TPA: hypothetical protein VN956_13890 [Pyrinomonadaceae bacterium]|jgi:hypothetical protein|nr:hypothetical protein [Pyrinomonadaceae bacterium]
MHFRLGVNPQHVTEWKKGRSNPSGETTLAIMGIAEERTGGARTALSSADRFAKDFSSGPDFVNQTHGLSGKEAHRLDVSGIPTLLFSERFAPDELAASSRFLLVSSVKAIGPRAGVVGPLNELFRETSPFARSR